MFIDKTKIDKYILITVFCAATVIICLVSADNEKTSWNNYFLDALSLEVDTVTGLDSLVETLDITASGSEVSLNLLQTVGDGSSLYILYEINLPTEWRSELVVLNDNLSNVAVKFQCVPANDNSMLKPDTPSMLDIAVPMQSQTTTVLAYDRNTCQLTCMSMVCFPNLNLYNQKMQFTLEEISVTSQSGESLVDCDDVLSVSWVAHNQGERIASKANDSVCEVSALGLYATIFSDEPMNADDIIHTLKVTYKDGTTVDSFGGSEGSSGNENGTQMVDIHVLPPAGTLFRISEISSIEVNAETYSFF